ncbi:MAG: metalloregulator ArsR/SmtB family transcription factor [Myxococcota bacterium]
MDDDRVFKALADPVRRALLDRLFRQGGLTLGELCEGQDMTRFGVMKHLRVLEEAHLVVARKVGREKLHYLNAVPIRIIHDRWIGKYAAQITAAMSGLKELLEADEIPRDARGPERAKKEKRR